MDVELRLPLLRWLDSAPSTTQLRKAIRIGTRVEIERRMTQAIVESVRQVLPLRGDSHDASSSGSVGVPVSVSVSLLPSPVQPHVAQFIKETIEGLTQLTTYLSTEQVRKQKRLGIAWRDRHIDIDRFSFGDFFVCSALTAS